MASTSLNRSVCRLQSVINSPMKSFKQYNIHEAQTTAEPVIYHNNKLRW